MAALLHDHPRTLLATEPVTRFLGLSAVPAAGVDAVPGVAVPPGVGLAPGVAASTALAAVLPAPVPVPAPAPRPPLRVIPGGHEAALRHRQAPAVYRRRRLWVLLGLLVFAVGTCLAFDLVRGPSPAPLLETAPVRAPTAAPAASSPAGSAPAAPSVAPAAPAGRPAVASASSVGTAPDSYLVQPGDTLWSIAEELAPGTDVRPLVDALAERSGGGVLEAGTRLDLRGLGG